MVLGGHTLSLCSVQGSRSVFVLPGFRLCVMCCQLCCSVRSKRRFVGPNPGFISQLRLYETMKWQVEKANVQFRMYRLQVAANQIKKGTRTSERNEWNKICIGLFRWC
jgi:hypothetical protein